MLANGPRRKRHFAVAALAAVLVSTAAVCGQDVSRAGLGLASFEGISVSSAERTDLSRLTDAGVLVADGAGTLVVTLGGELKSKTEKDGSIGVLLLPDVAPFETAFRSRRALLVTQEAIARISSGESGYFISSPQRFDVGFPRYRVLLYNTTGAAVSASVFVYRSR